MEIATGIVGASLAFLGLILAYIWRANGRYIRELMTGQERLQEGLVRLQEGQERMARALQEGLMSLQEGQKEIARITQEILREVRAKG